MIKQYLASLAAVVAVLSAFDVRPLHARQAQASQAIIEDPDFVEPASLAEHVSFSDVVIIGRLVRRLEPRVQTNPLQVGGKTVTYTAVFAQYLVGVERVLKAPTQAGLGEELIVEQAVGDVSLAQFRRGRPDLGTGSVMLFLKYYPPGPTFQIGAWNAQFKRGADGSVAPIGDRPAPAFLKEHLILGTAQQGKATGGEWVVLVQEVEALAERGTRR